MLDIRHILFPVDFSERCSASAATVAHMAEKFHARVTMLHVMHLVPSWYNELSAEAFASMVDSEALTRERRAALEDYLRYPQELCSAWRVVVEGEPGRVIPEFAANEKVDLIMMPTHGHGPFRRLLLGSVTAKVLHDAECPVWTDVHAVESYASRECRLVLCAVGLRRQDVRAIRWAADYAAALQSPLKLVHVIPAIEGPERPGEAAFRRYLVEHARQEIARFQCEAGTNVELIIEGGKIAQTVNDIALQQKADLIVIGQGSMHETLGRLRTNAYAIIREASCPVVRV
jgi:nucleotide-binding universal stress UspA family protein